MLAPAALYKDEITAALVDARKEWKRVRYLNISSDSAWISTPPDNDWNRIARVSVHDGKVIGRISASICRDTLTVTEIGAISFVPGDKRYILDLIAFVDELRLRFSYLRFTCIVGNDRALRVWRPLVQQYGGREIGIMHSYARSAVDGKLLDARMFEIPGGPAPSGRRRTVSRLERLARQLRGV